MAEDVYAEQFAFFVADEFAKAILRQISFCSVNVFIFPSIDSDLVAEFIPCLFFGQASAGQFRVGVCAPQYIFVICFFLNDWAIYFEQKCINKILYLYLK